MLAFPGGERELNGLFDAAAGGVILVATKGLLDAANVELSASAFSCSTPLFFLVLSLFNFCILSASSLSNSSFSALIFAASDLACATIFSAVIRSSSALSLVDFSSVGDVSSAVLSSDRGSGPANLLELGSAANGLREFTRVSNEDVTLVLLGGKALKKEVPAAITAGLAFLLPIEGFTAVSKEFLLSTGIPDGGVDGEVLLPSTEVFVAVLNGLLNFAAGGVEGEFLLPSAEAFVAVSNGLLPSTAGGSVLVSLLANGLLPLAAGSPVLLLRLPALALSSFAAVGAIVLLAAALVNGLLSSSAAGGPVVDLLLAAKGLLTFAAGGVAVANGLLFFAA